MNMEVLFPVSQPILSAVPSHCHEELVERANILRRNESFCNVKVLSKDEESNAHKVVPWNFDVLKTSILEASLLGLIFVF